MYKEWHAARGRLVLSAPRGSDAVVETTVWEERLLASEAEEVIDLNS